MKRQIKFRGKRVNGGEWVESMTISHGTIKRKSHDIFFETGENAWVGVIPETVGQFTGLVDKNGKEVYEGDVLRAKEFENYFMHEDDDFLDAFPLDELKGDLKKEYVSQVRFEDGGFILEIPDCIISLCAFFGNMKKSRPIFECEVIGNIHDNPELIEVNKES